jgi:hypothetical protein
MAEYRKSYRVGRHVASIYWGPKTSPKVTWSPPITEEQRRAVEATGAYEAMMFGFIAEATAMLRSGRLDDPPPNPAP